MPPPQLTVNITEPASGSPVQGTVTVAATASSNATRVELFLDGSMLSTVTGAAAAYTWDTTTAGNGAHQWVAKAYDDFGQSAQSPTVDVTVNNPAPPPPALTVAITQPVSGSTVQGTVTLAIAASSTATSIDLMFDGVVVDTVTDSAAQFAWDTTTVANGSHQWTAQAYDNFGQTALSAPVDVTVSNPPPADKTPPVVNLEPVTATKKAKTTLVATASDNVGVVKVEFYVNGVLQCTDTAAPYTCSWMVSNAAKTYVLEARAYDAAGNVGVSPSVTIVIPK